MAKKSPGKKSQARKTKPVANWPNERAVLYRPDRFQYVNKHLKSDRCVFCAAFQSGPSAQSLLLHSGKNAMVIMNKFPYNSGHLLILPNRHCGDFLRLNENEHLEMNALLKTSIRALKDIYQPSGFNIGLNLGASSGAGIPEHLHYHVIPRWNGDTNFFPLIAKTKVVIATPEQTYLKLQPFYVAGS